MGVRLVVRAAEGQALEGGLSYAFEQTRIVIGRGVGADVRLPHLTISERHALLTPQEATYAIEDLGSTNGTLLNGVRLVAERRRTLREGDRIEVGAYTLSFHTGVLVTETMTAERTAELARRLFRSSQRGALVGMPRLVVIAGPGTGRSLDVPAPPSRLLVGSSAACQLVIEEPAARPEHFELRRDLDGVLLRALHEAHGPHGPPERRLRDGDELQIGASRLLFEEPAEEPLQALSAEADAELIAAPLQPDGPTPASAPAAASGSANATSAAEADVAAEPAKVPRRAARRKGLEADLIIYALAAIVMAVSLTGLFVLIGE